MIKVKKNHKRLLCDWAQLNIALSTTLFQEKNISINGKEANLRPQHLIFIPKL
jgi:hypothetical protein